MFMSLVNSLATKGAEKYADNMIKGTNYLLLLFKAVVNLHSSDDGEGPASETNNAKTLRLK